MVTPQPRLSDIKALIEGMQRGSLTIHASESGPPAELSTGQQMAVFRIVQECLTNALKHGGRGTEVRLHVDWSGPGLTLHVASVLAGTDQSGAENPALARIGRGIPGMRERAHMAGGWMTAGPDGDHFRVTVFVPYGSREAGPGDPTAEAATEDFAAAAEKLQVQPILAGISLPRAAMLEQDAGNRG